MAARSVHFTTADEPEQNRCEERAQFSSTAPGRNPHPSPPSFPGWAGLQRARHSRARALKPRKSLRNHLAHVCYQWLTAIYRAPCCILVCVPSRRARVEELASSASRSEYEAK
jgi:hypothetical protein